MFIVPVVESIVESLDDALRESPFVCPVEFQTLNVGVPVLTLTNEKTAEDVAVPPKSRSSVVMQRG